MRTLFLAWVALSVVGCDDDPPDPEPAPVAAVAAPALEVPSLERGAAPASEATPLVVTRAAIRLGEGPALVTLTDGRVRAEDKTGGAEGFLVPALRDGMAEASTDETMSVAVHPAVPYRTVSEVIYTLGQGGHTDLAFVVRTSEGLAALPIVLPNLGGDSPRLLGALSDSSALADVLAGGAAGGPAADVSVPDAPAGDAPPRPPASPPSREPRLDDSTLNLFVTVAAGGITVSGSGGRLAPGCETIASDRAPTLPIAGGAHDLAGLTRCLENVKREFPDEDLAFVTADPEVRFADVAAAIAASRTTAQGQPLFPRTALAVGVR